MSDLRLYSIWRNPQQRLAALAVLALVDGYLGVAFNSGLISWSGILSGQLRWLALSVELMAGGIAIMRLLVGRSPKKWKALTVVITPVALTIYTLLVLELLLSSLGRSATMNFNLTSLWSSGLYWAAVYLSVAIGLTLTYKVQRYANFAQAELMLLGGYVALLLMWSDRFFQVSDGPKDDSINWSLLITAVISAFVITGLTGLFVDRIVYKRLRNKLAKPQVMMIASLGVAMILRALLYMRFSAQSYRFVPDRDWRLGTSKFDIATERFQLTLGERVGEPIFQALETSTPFGFTYPKIALIVGVFTSVVLLVLLLHRTRLGSQMRAVADNPDLAASSGIHVERVHGITAFLSAGITGLGGSLLVAVLPMNPELGLQLLLPAFAVIVLGTIGSVPGAIFGALVVGAVRAASEPFLIGAGNALDRPTASGLAEVMPFVFLVGVLLFIPQGAGHAFHQWNIRRVRQKRSDEETSIDKRNRWKDFSTNVGAKLSRLTEQIGVLFDSGIAKCSEIFDVASNRIGELYRSASPSVGRLSGLILSPIESIWNSTKQRAVTAFRLNNIDRETERGSWIAFWIFLALLVLVVLILPSVSNLTKTLQIARILTLVSIFGLMAFSLNLHTGITGMTNFGVIFFVGVGAVTVGLLAAPAETNGYGWSPWAAVLVAVLISGAAGWLLAAPTARLRMDYFAIVTISLGEMLRIFLQAEPLLRAGTVTSAMGISKYSRPLEGWWKSGPSETVGDILFLGGPAPYVALLAIMCLVVVVAVWYLLDTILDSPWGRILRSIREDEQVSQHHGHNILTHKAASLALGAAIAGLAGALWAWLNASIFPDFMSPVRSTFLVWAAFIVGGRANNRGMVIGAFLIVIVDFFFNVLVVSRGNSSQIFHGLVKFMDSVFEWMMVDLGGLIWSSRSITEAFPKQITVELSHLKVALVGAVILIALILSAKGLLPEIPRRPSRPSKTETDQSVSGSGASS